MRPSLGVALVALLALASPALADTVTLKDGRVLQGRTTVEADELVIRVKYGEVRVKRADIVRIDKEDDVYSQHERKVRELGQGTADERYRLGVWCRDHGLDSESRAAFLSVLKLDPDHAGARSALGYTRDDTGRWITEDDLMRLKGLVKFQGRWMSPADKVRAEAEIAERRAQARELAKKAEEEKLAKRKAKLEEERAARLARIRAYEEELARARAQRRAEEESNNVITFYTGPYGSVGGCNPVFYGWPRRYGGYSYWGGRPLSNTDIMTYVGWTRGLGRGTVRPYTGGYVTVRGGWGGGLYQGGTYWGGACGGSTYSYQRQRSGWGVGVQAEGSYQSRSGRTQVRFRTGF